jgi:hypothetical protein
VSPDGGVAAFRRLGCEVIPGRGKGSHVWMERLDAAGRQIAIINIPVTRNPIARGTLHRILMTNGIRDEAHLQELLSADDPPAEFLRVLPRGGPRWRAAGQPVPGSGGGGRGGDTMAGPGL